VNVAVITSHPIQYQIPLFRKLSSKVNLTVYFAHRTTAKDQSDAGFGVEFEWDVDLLQGYRYEYLPNHSKQPNVNSYSGCDTPEIIQILNSGDYKAIIVYGWYLKVYIQAIRAANRLNIPVLVRGDSQLPGRSKLYKRFIKRMLLPVLFKKIDGFLSVGKRFDDYLEYYGVDRTKIFWMPHSVDNQYFSDLCKHQNITRSRQRFTQGEQDLLVLFVGKFIEKKHPLDIIRALGSLNSSKYKVKAIFVGDGNLKSEMLALAEKLHVNIFIEGFKNQSQLPEYYSLADMLVLPSDEGETWGLVVNEAMACGLPAIVSNLVGCSEDLILDGETGYTYLCGHVDELANAIKKTATSFAGSSRRKKIIMHINQYSIDMAVKHCVSALQQIVER